MKDILLTTLRDKNTGLAEFRHTTENLASIMAQEASLYLETEFRTVETPLKATSGFYFKNSIVLVPILRAGLALLYPFMRFFPYAKVGFIGMRRNETNFEPYTYYHNIPPIQPQEEVLILEPMIATGGSGVNAISLIKKEGVKEEQILFLSILAAPSGLQRISQEYPKVRIHALQIDESLNDHKFIVPGLGDFGDRYFGTVT